MIFEIVFVILQVYNWQRGCLSVISSLNSPLCSHFCAFLAYFSSPGKPSDSHSSEHGPPPPFVCFCSWYFLSWNDCLLFFFFFNQPSNLLTLKRFRLGSTYSIKPFSIYSLHWLLHFLDSSRGKEQDWALLLHPGLFPTVLLGLLCVTASLLPHRDHHDRKPNGPGLYVCVFAPSIKSTWKTHSSRFLCRCFFRPPSRIVLLCPHCPMAVPSAAGTLASL